MGGGEWFVGSVFGGGLVRAAGVNRWLLLSPPSLVLSSFGDI
jgi:hypothetical protein